VWLDHLPVASFQDSRDGQGTLIETRTTWLYPDHLGTPRLGMNAARQITWKYQSEAFGVASITGPDVVNLRLPGQISLGMLGIHYNYYRDYDPYSGRYLESDPIGIEGGLNTYSYVSNGPTGRFDIAGLQESVDELLCKRSKVPIRPDRCVSQQECFKNAKNGAAQCQRFFASPVQSYVCSQCWKAFAAKCIDHEGPAPDCSDLLACATPAPSRQTPW
jgi:RHS repeat-associated protein